MSAVAISVDSVQPLYGPVAGGTLVTITGQLLSVSTVKAVYFGQYKGYLDANRLSFLLIFIIIGVTSDDFLAYGFLFE